MFGSVCWVGHFFLKFDRGKLGKIVKKKQKKNEKHTHTGHTVLRLSIQKDHTKTKKLMQII